ncbi:hypothetical protein BDV96DRAFT_595787 [Lophiotrema nucula]|uniref:Uncharacterized protein n=1 Tax=Lophiotrema nucula TaxID=690887 RepID=A0A6A5ZMX7_9PLEO|nr:hypothetical protein BDV96DRAFT_595787 [Lophiotrema nucula]
MAQHTSAHSITSTTHTLKSHLSPEGRAAFKMLKRATRFVGNCITGKEDKRIRARNALRELEEGVVLHKNSTTPTWVEPPIRYSRNSKNMVEEPQVRCATAELLHPTPTRIWVDRPGFIPQGEEQFGQESEGSYAELLETTQNWHTPPIVTQPAHKVSPLVNGHGIPSNNLLESEKESDKSNVGHTRDIRAPSSKYSVDSGVALYHWTQSPFLDKNSVGYTQSIRTPSSKYSVDSSVALNDSPRSPFVGITNTHTTTSSWYEEDWDDAEGNRTRRDATRLNEAMKHRRTTWKEHDIRP